MRNKNYFSVSWPLILENIKIYWYVPALSFIIYFFAGIFPIVLYTSKENAINQYIYHSLANYNLFYCLLMIFVPLIAAVQMMGFVHNEKKSLAIHAQPFSKSKIFNSHIFTGWIMCILPVLLTAICYLLFMRETIVDSNFSSDYLYPENAYEKVNVYTLANIVKWLLSSVGIITFFYGIYILAGSLTGNTAMHVLTAGVFFGIIPIITWLASAYCSSFLTGYSGMSAFAENFLLKSNPILQLVSYAGHNSTVLTSLMYLCIGIFLIIISRLAYTYTKLEKVGDSMPFRIVEEIITYLVVFVGMTAFAFFFMSLNNSNSMFIFGMLIGTLVTFAIIKIIINKSIKIITRQNLCSLAVYVVAAALLLSVTMYDITGYAKRIPTGSSVESVQCSDLIIYFQNSTYVYTSGASEDFFKKEDEIESDEFKAKVLSLHKYIVDNELYESNEYYDDNMESFNFIYKLKNGLTFKRNFNVVMDENMINLIDAIISDENYIKNSSILGNVNTDAINYAEIINYFYENEIAYTEKYEDDADYEASANEDADYETSADEISTESQNALIQNKDQILALLEAYDKDVAARTYEELFNGYYNSIASLSVFSKGGEELWFEIKETDKNLIACINKLGYGYTVNTEQ